MHPESRLELPVPALSAAALSGVEQRTYETAVHLIREGYHPIPLLGITASNSRRAKRPAVRWREYVKQAVTIERLATWRRAGHFRGGALGLMMGRGVFAVDFDRRDDFARFMETFPQFSQTRIVETRRGFHVYFRAPEAVRVPTQNGVRGEIKGIGAYVVSPGSVIDGHEYRDNSQLPVSVTAEDIESIRMAVGAIDSSDGNSERNNSTSADPAWMVSEFKRQAARLHSRNAGAYQTALRMGRTGVPMAAVRAALCDAFSETAPFGDHPEETRQQREMELDATLRSAYRRAESRLVGRNPETNSLAPLPNAVRESLLQAGHTAIARLIDALAAVGFDGPAITVPLAVQTLARFRHANGQTVFSAKVIRAALATTYSAVDETTGEMNLFPFCRTYIPVGNVVSAVGGGDKTGTNSPSDPELRVQPPRRPATVHRLPERAALVEVARTLAARQTGAAQSGKVTDFDARAAWWYSDPLPEEAFLSNRAYRQAVHAALIERRPGQYTSIFFGRRLGRSRRTVQRYNRESGVISEPRFNRIILDEALADNLPDDPEEVARFGGWIEAPDGQKFPPRRSLAVHMLKRGRRPTLVRQAANFYRMPDRNAGAASGSSPVVLPDVKQLDHDQLIALRTMIEAALVASKQGVIRPDFTPLEETLVEDHSGLSSVIGGRP